MRTLTVTGERTERLRLAVPAAILLALAALLGAPQGVAAESLDPGTVVAAQVEESEPAPVFDEGAAATRQVAESANAGVHVGGPVTATAADDNDAALTYSLSGAAEFTIDAASGQIRVAGGAALDFETKSSYLVTVGVSDGKDASGDPDAAIDATISVTIAVTDVDEPPPAPVAPAVTRPASAPETSLDVTWTAPDTTGRPPLTDYDVRYRVPGEGWSSAVHDGTATTTTLTGLIANTTYEVQVSASNAEGGGPWSESGSGTTALEILEPSPVFDEGDVGSLRQVAENSAAGTAVGHRVTATDTNDAILTYALSGADEFTIDASSGQVRVASGAVLDYEEKDSYVVTVSVSDGKDQHGYPDPATDDTISFTIELIDELEPPPALALLVVSASAANPQTSLGVDWSAPDMTGRPPLSGYDVRYRVQGSTGWSRAAHDGTATTAMLDGLTAGTTYDVQVKAINDEGSSPWTSVTATTAAEVTEPQSAPVFDEGAATTRRVAENTPWGHRVGDRVTATDADGDALTYALSGADQFTIDAASGRIYVAREVVLDYETTTSYTVTVSVSDGKDLDGNADAATDATISVTIYVTDQTEKPPQLDGPTVSPRADDAETSLDVAWSAPDMTGKPAITRYDLRYRPKTPDNGWSTATYDDTRTSTTLTGLIPGTTYLVQVRATNADGSSEWSDHGEGTTAEASTNSGPTNVEPKFLANNALRTVAENSGVGTAVGEPIAATDADADTLTYSLSTPPDSRDPMFTIDAASGQIRVASGAVLNYEDAVARRHSMTVWVTDGKSSTGGVDASGDVSIAVMIDVSDELEPPPTLAAPSVTPTASAPQTSLDVTWVAPDMTGKPSIDTFDVRYRVQGHAAWSTIYASFRLIVGGAEGQLRTATLEDLIAGTTYEVEVRATNDEGTSPWSDAGTGTTAAEVRESNPPPVFDEGTAAFRQVAEDSGSGSAVGEPVIATDSNDDTLAYSLGGADEFTVDADSGQIRVASGVVLDFEAQPSYTVTLSVSDGKDLDGDSDATADATISVTIDLTDVNEPPPTPAAPFVTTPSSGAQTSLDVFWTAPDMTGRPPITDYEVRYRVQGSTGWSGGAYRGISTSTTLIGLFAGATYEVQVLASNAEGSSPWSASGTRTTVAAQQKSGPNEAPRFDQGASVVRKVAENAAAGTALGAAVTAFDPDGDTLIYSLSGSDQFTISAAGGQISVAPGAGLDFEANPSYTVTVSASDGRDDDGGADATADAHVSVSIELIDVAELPTAPAAPVVRRSGSDPETALDVSWVAPDMSGKPPITDYDVRYRAQGSIGWSNANHDGPNRNITLKDLAAGTPYEVQVLARNEDGSSPWSASGRTALKDYEPAPAFDEGAAATRRVTENSRAGTAVGAPVTATDANDSALTYSLSGALDFAIDATGQIRVASGAVMDYEAQPSYTVTVSVSDGKDRTGKAEDDPATDASISVTIEVRDVDEPPPAVGTPVVTRPAGSETSLDVTWTAPNMSGKPEITGYDVQYRESDTTAWMPHAFSGTGVETTITRLQESTRYEVQVRARNDEGIGRWSPIKATRPMVQISGPSETQTGRFAVHFTVMPEDVADFDGADVEVTNGSVESFEHLGRGTYVARIKPEATGTVSVRVPAGSFHGDGKANRESSLYQVEVEDSVPSVPAEVSFALEENRAGPVVLGAITDGTPQGVGGWTYTIASGAAGKFEIEEATGRLSYVGEGEDYETPPSSYTLTVTTTSVSGRTASTVVMVHVVNVNEPPQPVGKIANWVMHSGASITFNSEPYFVDPDGDSLQYKADSSDPVVATVQTSSPPVTITAQAEGRTMVTVTTCDPANECATQEMEVRVLEENIDFIPDELEVKEGAQETYTVNLLDVPPGRVTITLTSADPGAATVSPGQLTFNPDNWDTGQPVTVAGVPDADHVDETVTVIHSASGMGYRGSAEFTVTVMDDDVAGVRLDPTAVRMDEGAQQSYEVSLLSEPRDEVTVTLTSPDPKAVTVSPERLIFYSGNWDRPQRVTVTAVPDADHADETVIVTHTAREKDYQEEEEYKDAKLTVTVEDDEVAGVVLSKTEVRMPEGAQASYTVSLRSEPRAEVTVTLTSADTNVVTFSPAQLIFNPDNWDTPQRVTVTGVHDDDIEPGEDHITHTGREKDYQEDYQGAEFTVTVEDDDEAGVTLNPSAVRTDEGGQETSAVRTDEGAQVTYAVSLLSEPRAEVTITLTSADPKAATVSPLQLIFNPDNWNTPQLVTVAGVPDDDHADETVTVIHSASGPGYQASAEFTVTVEDDDVAGVTLDPSAVRTDEGGQESYTVSLLTEPRAEVTVTLTSADPKAATVSPMQLNFNRDNWNAPQLVTVTGVPDDDHADETVIVSHTARGPDYQGSAELTVTVEDDEVAGAALSRTEVRLVEGAQASYTVSLLSQPPGEVTVTVTSADINVVTVTPAQLTFYPGNWDLPQRVTAAGVPDDDAEDGEVDITHTASGPGYDGGAAATVTASVEDDDEKGVTFTPTAIRIGDGTTMRGYGVVLDTVPSDRVTIVPESEDPGTLRVTPERLTFTPDNWNQRQYVTITSSEIFEDQTVRVLHQVSGANYEEIAAAAVTVAVVDDERAQRSLLAEHWLARFGRTVGSHAVDNVRGRVAATSGEAYVTLNGLRLGDLPSAASDAAPAPVSVAGPAPSLQQLAGASAFQAEGFRPGLVLWGRGAFTDFEDQPTDDLALNGDVLSGHLGADYRFNRQWQAGVAVSYTGGAGDVADREASADADVTSWLVSGYPYVRFSPLDELAVWLALGLGYGEMELDDAPRPVRPEIAMYLAAAGIDSTLLTVQHFRLALSADAFAVRMESSDSAPALPALSVDVQSVRLLLEGHAKLGLTSVSRLEPSLELGARFDGSDSENGIGGEVGGGLAYVNTALGLNVEARGRYLLMHQESALHQWGASLMVSLAPGGGEGLSLSLAPAWGVAASGGDAALHDAGQVAASDAEEQLRGLQPDQMDLAVGYGVKVGDRGLLTPFGELGVAREATRMRVGLRLGGAESPAAEAPLEVYVGRDATTQDAANPEYHFGLNASIRA